MRQTSFFLADRPRTDNLAPGNPDDKDGETHPRLERESGRYSARRGFGPVIYPRTGTGSSSSVALLLLPIELLGTWKSQ
jgi:hypothetical protein